MGREDANVDELECEFWLPIGGTRGIQSQYISSKQLFKEDPPGERAVAAVWLPVLLLHAGLQFVARNLPQQKGEETHSHTPNLFRPGVFNPFGPVSYWPKHSKSHFTI